MGKFDVKVNYLYNSGFSVETKNFLLIFDYYLDSVTEGDKRICNGGIGSQDLEGYKNILVFSSHSHSDHYNNVIFEWKKVNSNIDYILSSDIEVESKIEGIHRMSAYEELSIKGVTIKAFGSTDIGISFLVRVDGVDLFHSGDLNWWHWWDEDEISNKNAEKLFKLEIDKIRGNNVDICFFPIDGRLKDFYYLGGEYFMKEIDPKILIPMHFREEFELTREFARKFKGSSTKVLEIANRGQEIIL